MLAAKFPGSIYATLATNAAPKYRHISPRLSVGSSLTPTVGSRGATGAEDIDMRTLQYKRNAGDASTRSRKTSRPLVRLIGNDTRQQPALTPSPRATRI